jgi:hypothetical protein
MRGLALFRIGLGGMSWLAPYATARLFGTPEDRNTPELAYMTRVFGARAIALGSGFLASNEDGRSLWHRLWLLCDAADTVMGVGMVARGRVGLRQGAPLVAVTGAAMALDVARIRDEQGSV